MVAHLSHLWKDDPVKGGEEPYLNAAIVGWNLRDKKVAESPMTFLRPKDFAFTAGRHHFTPIYAVKFERRITLQTLCPARSGRSLPSTRSGVEGSGAVLLRPLPHSTSDDPCAALRPA